jgi:hypothetical protein
VGEAAVTVHVHALSESEAFSDRAHDAAQAAYNTHVRPDGTMPAPADPGALVAALGAFARQHQADLARIVEREARIGSYGAPGRQQITYEGGLRRAARLVRNAGREVTKR